MMVAKPKKKSPTPIFSDLKENVFFNADFRKKKMNFLTHRRLKVWIAYTKSGLPRLKS